MKIKSENNYEEPKYPKKGKISKKILATALVGGALITTVGIAKIYNENQKYEVLSGMTSQDLPAFNWRWEQYEGNQKGSNIKSLLSSLTANAQTNVDTSLKIPNVKIEIQRDNVINVECQNNCDISAIEEYQKELVNARNEIVSSHNYSVKLEYADGYVNKIIIEYIGEGNQH